MNKKIRASLAVLLSVLMALSSFVLTAAAAGAKASYTIDSPYADVDWEAWTGYKGSLHTHSTLSDADTSLRDMVFGAYNQGFDFLAFSDHGVTGKAWNEDPVLRVFYTYQAIMGLDRSPLTDEEFTAITTGTYADATGEARGKGMFCVTGANELNAVTMTKSHVNGYFLPEDYGNANWGFENGFEYAVSQVDKLGGLSHINHPGDWLESEGNIDAVMDPDTIAYFSDILLRYNSCLGIEATNGGNGTTPYDRVLWDNILQYCLPYGRTVYGFSNSDAHDVQALDHAFGTYWMPGEVSMESLRTCMEKGQFFGVARRVFANNIIGPVETLSAAVGPVNQQPVFNALTVDGHNVTVKTQYAERIRWIADGRILFAKDLTDGETVSINLDDYDGAEHQYIRCELYNDNGMTFSQPLVINDGSEAETYIPDTNPETIVRKGAFVLMSTRIYVLFQELVRILVNKFSDLLQQQ